MFSSIFKIDEAEFKASLNLFSDLNKVSLDRVFSVYLK
jgi:hypothetical protein